ncbi:hypothetical protein WMY93_024412 [Mugilogobius chulae]|uniref:Uncharacterized protein n=1 Tax=Mugilogobius chulae TaxID=88201 RepID=A0AAW0NAK0_9GOBI
MERGGRLTLLVCVLAMHLMPLAVHGNEVLSNGTEPEISANLTSLLPQEAEPDQAVQSVVTVTGPDTVSTVSTLSPRVGRLPRAGEQEGHTEQGSGMFSESVVPVSQEEVVPSQISPDSAETSTFCPAHELQGGDPTSWALPDSYDYLTPYDDGASPTAEDYYMTTTDAYESDVDLRLSRTRSRLPSSGSFLPGVGRAGVSGPVKAPPVDGSDGRGAAEWDMRE